MATNKFLENLRETNKSKEEIKPDEESVDRDSDGSPMDAKHSTLACQLIFKNRNAPAAFYGLMQAALHDPSHGIQFVFEGVYIPGWNKLQKGWFRVSIFGNNLDNLYAKLMSGVRTKIREGSDTVDRIEVGNLKKDAFEGEDE